jgi:hypothetical protein
MLQLVGPAQPCVGRGRLIALPNDANSRACPYIQDLSRRCASPGPDRRPAASAPRAHDDSPAWASSLRTARDASVGRSCEGRRCGEQEPRRRPTVLKDFLGVIRAGDKLVWPSSVIRLLQHRLNPPARLSQSSGSCVCPASQPSSSVPACPDASSPGSSFWLMPPLAPSCSRP